MLLFSISIALSCFVDLSFSEDSSPLNCVRSSPGDNNGNDEGRRYISYYFSDSLTCCYGHSCLLLHYLYNSLLLQRRVKKRK
ncbi:unnamed protein product [Haemonchus placei]|uniref:Secreted protein n=1 Tax=Haemonchus placei TaxID=6290 RepID=A0A158QPN5_HAEPC|nr:unnamed protein product [Haemonchus placei]